MKLGVSAFAWTAKFHREHLALLPKIKEAGLDGLEIPMFDPAQLGVQEIRQTFEANAVECTVCAILPDAVNPISPDAAVRKKSLEHLIACVETSAALGARVLGGPLYAPIGYLPGHRPNKDEWLWAVEIFQKLGEILDVHKMTLSIEPVNRSETFFLRTAKEADSFCEAVGHPRIGVTIDTFHANIEERDIVRSIHSLGSRLKHMHLSENDRGPLGQGHVDFPGIVLALQQIKYEGYLMIEGFGYSPDEKSAPGFLWAETHVSPEDVAFKGAEYLRGLLNQEMD